MIENSICIYTDECADWLESFITRIALSFPHASQVYANGGCYQFHLILKEVFPSAEPYYIGSDEIVEHVITKIGNYFYDINGIFFLVSLERKLKGRNLEIAKRFSAKVKVGGPKAVKA